jgi:hypothetical protein
LIISYLLSNHQWKLNVKSVFKRNQFSTMWFAEGIKKIEGDLEISVSDTNEMLIESSNEKFN